MKRVFCLLTSPKAAYILLFVERLFVYGVTFQLTYPRIEDYNALGQCKITIQQFLSGFLYSNFQVQDLLKVQLLTSSILDHLFSNIRNPFQLLPPKCIEIIQVLIFALKGQIQIHYQTCPNKIQKIILQLSTMMLNAKAATALQNQRFRIKLEDNCPNYAYEILLLQIIVEDDQYPRKPTMDEISKLISLYMLAVQVLQGASDKRYDYFKRKIHSLMLKKHIVEQMHFASGSPADQKTLQDCARADLESRKNEHEAQIFFNKTDNSKVQEILKKAEHQVKTFNTNIRKNIMTQQEQLQQRIKNRKLKSQNGGSLSKYKLQSHNTQVKEQNNTKIDPRMEYFDDYEQIKKPKIGTSKNIRGNFGSIQKIDIKKIKDYS